MTHMSNKLHKGSTPVSTNLKSRVVAQPLPRAIRDSGTVKLCPRNNRVAAGFTILELMVAMAIVALMFGLTAPQFARMFRKAETDRILGGLAGALRYAHQEAVFKGSPLKVVIDFQAGRYWIAPIEESKFRHEQIKKHQGILEYPYFFESVKNMHKNEYAYMNQTEVFFWPNGTADPVKIVVVADDPDMQRDPDYGVILVRGGTSRVIVKKGHEARKLANEY